MDWLEVLKTLGVTVPVVGGAIAWIWNKIEKRITVLEEEVRSCHGERAALLAAAEMLYVELNRVASRSHTLRRARQLLDLAGKSLAED